MCSGVDGGGHNGVGPSPDPLVDRRDRPWDVEPGSCGLTGLGSSETTIPSPRPATAVQTSHAVVVGDARELTTVADDSVELVVTSPPYPMIEM